MEKILVVEDSPAIREMILKHLELEGLEPAGASDGKEALETIQKINPQLIVLDIMLPEVDGWEVLLKLREEKEFAAFSEIPVIMLSAKSEDISKLTAFRHGADDYLTKPFNPDILIARIRAILKRSKAESLLSPDFRKNVRIPVEKGDVTKLAAPEEICWCENQGRKTYVRLADGLYPCRLSLIELQDKLPRESFLRIHRSYLINTGIVDEVRKHPGGRYSVLAKAGETVAELPVSRRSTADFKSIFSL